MTNCAICRTGELVPSRVTVTLERGESAILVREVPARICNNCGEECVDEGVAERAFAIAEEAARHGLEVEVRRYVA